MYIPLFTLVFFCCFIILPSLVVTGDGYNFLSRSDVTLETGFLVVHDFI